jgi:hypothetical protein
MDRAAAAALLLSALRAGLAISTFSDCLRAMV